MDEFDERILVIEWRGNRLALAAPENEAGFGAVDTHLLHLRVGQVLCQWAQRRYRSEDPPPEVLRLGSVELDLFADHAAYELIDPTLVLHAQTGAIPPRQLGAQLGFDATSHERFDSAGLGAHGWAATAMACSSVETSPSPPLAVPELVITAVRCKATEAYTNAGACLDDTTTTRPPATDAWTSIPSANGDTEG